MRSLFLFIKSILSEKMNKRESERLAAVEGEKTLTSAERCLI